MEDRVELGQVALPRGHALVTVFGVADADAFEALAEEQRHLVERREPDRTLEHTIRAEHGDGPNPGVGDASRPRCLLTERRFARFVDDAAALPCIEREPQAVLAEKVGQPHHFAPHVHGVSLGRGDAAPGEHARSLFHAGESVRAPAVEVGKHIDAQRVVAALDRTGDAGFKVGIRAAGVAAHQPGIVPHADGQGGVVIEVACGGRCSGLTAAGSTRSQLAKSIFGFARRVKTIEPQEQPFRAKGVNQASRRLSRLAVDHQAEITSADLFQVVES